MLAKTRSFNLLLTKYNIKMIQKYFLEKIISFEEIKGHFNKNYKVETISGFFHLKIFENEEFEIKKWIEGKTIENWNEQEIKNVCQELKILHKQKHQWQRMNYKKININDSKYNLILKKYENLDYVPCHNDLNKDNIIVNSSKACLIDFEFKRLNNKHWDIANIINEDNLNQEQILLFLKHYNELDQNTLNDFIYINKVFITEWKIKFYKNKS